MPEHKDLTGSQLHEPKGVASASASTVYVADGAGSGTWKSIPADSLDNTSIANINKGRIYVRFPDVSAPSSIFIPIVEIITVTKITSVLQGSITGADSVVTAYNNSGISMGSFTVSYSGSAAGDKDSVSPSVNNTFLSGHTMKITSDGASSTSAELIIVIEYTVTP